MRGIDESVHVPVRAAAAFLARIESVNRRASRLRLGIAVAVVHEGEAPRRVSVTREALRDGTFVRETSEEVMPCALFRLSCPEPVVSIPGWSFVGYVAAKRAERDAATGSVKAMSYTPFTTGHRLPQGVLDDAFGPSGMMRCDHCGTFRNRRLGIVVGNADGAHRIVGSACVRDYLGHDPKAILRHFQHVSTLRREVDFERRDGWYQVTEYDFAARQAAEDAVRARREGKAHDVVDIVGAALVAMAEQGFYARYDGGAKRATVGRVEELLLEGPALTEAELARAREILDWARERRHPGLPAGGSITLADYRLHDPEHRIVEAYKAAGLPPVGRFHDGGIAVALMHVSTERISDGHRDQWLGSSHLRLSHSRSYAQPPLR